MQPLISTMKKILLMLLLLAIGTALYAQTHYNISGNGLNLRNEPNTSATVVTSIPPNAKITVLDKSNSEWYKVKYDGKTGYVSAKYISENPQQNNTSNNNTASSSKKSNNNSNKSNSRSSASASTYNTGIGIRFGGRETGLTVKHFLNNKAAIEGILSSGWYYRGMRLTGLYEVQKPLGSGGLSWFWGVGGHIGMYNERYWYRGDCKDGRYEYRGRWYNCDGSRATLGIDGIIGLEFKFPSIPLTLGVDLKPSIDLFGWGNHYGDSAFTIRYTF